MAKDQKGFIVYGDIKATSDELSDEQLGKLFRGMIDYFVNGECPQFTDSLKFAFIPIKQQMDRDAEKYDKRCEKNRENVMKRYERIQTNTNVYDGIRTYTNATNTNTNTNTKTKTNKDTDTTTTTDTKCGGGDCGDDIRKRLSPDDMDLIWESYPNTGGDLVDAVAADVKAKKKHVANPVPYILGYAMKVGWDDTKEGEVEWLYTT